MSSTEFPYTGAAASFVVPTGITIVLFEAWGAADDTSGVRGGYSARAQTVTPGETIQVNTGGSTAAGGFNGGASGIHNGAGGTDFRQGGTALANRVLVAGGAAGVGTAAGQRPGAGGADVGESGVGFASAAGHGGSQTAGGTGGAGGVFGTSGSNGTLGTGGAGANALCGGGGGGYEGGGGGAWQPSTGGYPGGGGSNHGGTMANARGVASPDGSFNGYARVSWGDFTVTQAALNAPPRNSLVLLGSAGATVTISRVDSTGVPVPVRGADPGALTGGGWIGYDYEAPYNEPVTYTAATDVGETFTVSVPALRDSGAQQAWLVHPGTPDLSVPLNGPKIGDETRDVLQGVHVVLSREDPVVITDGARKSPAFDLTIKATSTAEDAAIKAMLADTSTLLLQYVFPFTDIYDYYWVAVGQTTRARMTGDYGQPYYLWTLPCTVTGAPSGLQQAQWSWADVLADYATWADVAAAYGSWADVDTNNPIGG